MSWYWITKTNCSTLVILTGFYAFPGLGDLDTNRLRRGPAYHMATAHGTVEVEDFL